MELKLSLVFLLTGFIAAAQAEEKEKRSIVCYGDLGCFSTGGAFTSLHRPVNLNPESPTEINTRFLLFTKQNSGNKAYQYIHANNFNSIKESNFQSSRKTMIISHGFLDNGFTDWMMDMKTELLKYGDYNVILIDWGGGSGLPYTQATANTRVVGAEAAKLIKTLKDLTSARAEDFHLIGHSLGAHICGYAGARTPNLGRISGLDPADPYFQYTDTSVRLDPSDAKFVDVMHTNGANILSLGYGMVQACGHVDYYPNEGLNQPGCDVSPVTKMLTEADIFNGGKQVVACSHLRAYFYYTESINGGCPFNGYTCDSYSSFEKGSCLPCTGDNCGYMGFHADLAKPPAGKTHVKYYLDTGKQAPYCRYHYQIKVRFGELGAKSEKGTIFVNLIGSNGQLGEQQLNKDVMEVQPGHTYGFVVTSTHDVGNLAKISFRWDLDSHWYNPLTWSFLSHHAIQIDTVDIVNGETNNRHKFCGFSEDVETTVTKTFTRSC